MIKAIVTDIEGTTSSLSFVKDVLFPYARRHLPDFVRNHLDDGKVQALLADARREAAAELDTDQLIAQFLDWIDRDQKITSLKSLQGMIWETGYEQGDFHGHIYPDAFRQLQAFSEQGYQLFVYSSGSVFAQKLLFAHTEYGDLTPLFSGFFDTHIGGKKEISSYQQIAGQIRFQPDEILFLSDIKEELDAARQAGFDTYWLVRGQSVNSNAEHRQICDFDAIQL